MKLPKFSRRRLAITMTAGTEMHVDTRGCVWRRSLGRHGAAAQAPHTTVGHVHAFLPSPAPGHRRKTPPAGTAVRPSTLVLRKLIGLQALLLILCLQGLANADDSDPLGDLDNEETSASRSEDDGVIPAGSADDSDDLQSAQNGADGPESAPGSSELETELDGAEPDSGTAAFANRLVVSAGAGIGMRGLRTTSPSGPLVLPDSSFVAVDLALRADFADGWQAQLHYQTSVLFRVQPPRTADKVKVNSDRAELTIGPKWALGDSDDAVQFAVPVGGALRSFWHAAKHSPIPRFALFGVLARPELTLQIAEPLSVRVGVEGQWLFVTAGHLGASESGDQVLGVGAEACASLELKSDLWLQVSYRESFATAVGGDATFEDVERFATARLTGAL